MPFKTWDDTRYELALALERLWSGEFLILGEPVPAPRPGLGPFVRRRPAPTRYVQVLRVEEVFSAECVGAASLGGTWEMPPQTIGRLRRLGWLTPSESAVAYGDHHTPNFEQHVEHTDLPELADILVATLHLLGVLPQELELETSGGSTARAGG